MFEVSFTGVFACSTGKLGHPDTDCCCYTVKIAAALLQVRQASWYFQIDTERPSQSLPMLSWQPWFPLDGVTPACLGCSVQWRGAKGEGATLADWGFAVRLIRRKQRPQYASAGESVKDMKKTMGEEGSPENSGRFGVATEPAGFKLNLVPIWSANFLALASHGGD